MNKTIFIIILVILGISTIVIAQDALYISTSVVTRDQNIIDALEEIDFNVNPITDDDITSTDFNNYHLIIISDGLFDNYDSIPVTQKECLLLNSDHLGDWGIIQEGTIGRINYGNNYLKGKIVNNDTEITHEFETPITLYDTYGIQSYYLPKRPSISLGLLNLVAKDDFDSNPYIGVIPEGGQLYIGGDAQAKTAFIGLVNSDFWTDDAKTLFQNTALWLIDHYEIPRILNLSAKNIEDESATILIKTKKLSNATLYYGLDASTENQQINDTFSLNHEFSLTGLTEATTYYYKVEVCGETGYCKNSSIENFTTLDLTAPTLLSTSIENLTNQSVNITFEINEESSLKLFIDDQLNQESATNTIHSFNIENLAEKTEYNYFIEMCDLSSNCANSSTYSFTTLDLTPPLAPTNLQIEVILPDQKIKLSWDCVIDATTYNIYESTNKTELGTLIGSTSDLEYIVETPLDNKAYYIVRAEDQAGNEENNSNQLMKYDLDLKEGENLISIPLTPMDNRIRETLKQNSSFEPIEKLTRFNSSTQSMESISYYPASGWQTSSIFNSIETLQGYFILSNTATKFTIVGYPTNSLEIELVEGMNLIGLMLIEQENDLPAISPIKEIASRNTDGTYSVATYYGGEGWVSSNKFNITTGNGYWIKSESNFSLVIS